MTHLPAGFGRKHFTVTPNDDADLAEMAHALFVGTGGTVAFHDEDGNAETWTVADSCYILCAARRVLATGTTATDIKGVRV